MSVSLYEQVMRADFAKLDPQLQAFHRLAGVHVLHGEVRVQAPWSPLGRLAAKLMGAPTRSGQGPIRFRLEATPQWETWQRHFPTGGAMASRLELGTNCVVERLGPLRMEFALEEDAGRLQMRMLRMRAFGMPFPAWLWPQVIAEESGRGNRIYFVVRAALPLVGPVAAYTGYLELPATEGGVAQGGAP